MSNMSYCRFRNTYEDLRECWANMDDDLSDNREEFDARIVLVELCKKIAEEYDGYDGWSVPKELEE